MLFVCVIVFGFGPSRPIQAESGPDASLDVRVVADQAEAALAILEKRRAGETIGDADWKRMFESEAFRRLEMRQVSFDRPVDRDAFRAWLVSDSVVGRVETYREAIEWWKALDAVEPARRAGAYLPEDSTIEATIYPMIKPTPNSFVFELDTDPAIFMYVNPERSRSELLNTLAHELHHVGSASCGEPENAGSLGDGARTALEWLGGFGEGMAVLAAAGGPGVHPHAQGSDEAWVVWERDVARFARDLERLDNFFLDLVRERLTDEAEIRERGFAFIVSEGVPQGPFYTVGWKMAAVVEKAEGRETVVRGVCDPRTLLAAYDRIAAEHSLEDGSGWPRWSPELLEALGARPAGE